MGFGEFLGNERIVTALRGALRTGRVPHALLFTGPRGVGKYTLGRILAQAANCERMTDDACGECATCRSIGRLADTRSLVEQGLAERGESADAATVERIPLILQPHPDVWAVVPDPVRLKNPVARPVLRIGQLRAVQRAAYFQPIGRRRVFLIDGAETMRLDVSNVFLKVLEEPPGSATLILTAPSPFALLPTVVSRCMQFHFAPLPEKEVEAVVKAQSERKAGEAKLAAQLSGGSPGLAMEMNLEEAVEKRKAVLRVIERAAKGQGFSQIFTETAGLAKDKEFPFEELMGVYYALLADLLQLTSGTGSPVLRNPHMAKELEGVARGISTGWVMKAIAEADDVTIGARRNLNRQLSLDAMATKLALKQGEGRR